MEEKDNIFDTASKKLSKSNDSPPNNTPPPKPQPKKENPLTVNSETRAMLNKMEDMKRDLEEKLEKFRKKMGFTEEQLKKYLYYTRKLNLDKWDAVKQRTAEMENRLKQIFGSGYIPVDVEENLKPGTEAQKSAKPLTDKERKGKTIGSRRKWMPMK